MKAIDRMNSTTCRSLYSMHTNVRLKNGYCQQDRHGDGNQFEKVIYRLFTKTEM